MHYGEHLYLSLTLSGILYLSYHSHCMCISLKIECYLNLAKGHGPMVKIGIHVAVIAYQVTHHLTEFALSLALLICYII